LLGVISDLFFLLICDLLGGWVLGLFLLFNFLFALRFVFRWELLDEIAKRLLVVVGKAYL
jgi:hypothetical protein